MSTILDRLNEIFPKHEISHTINDDGYSDIEITIDGYFTGIWVDDYDLYINEWNKSSWDFIFPQVRDWIDDLVSIDYYTEYLNNVGYEFFMKSNNINDEVYYLFKHKNPKIPAFPEYKLVRTHQSGYCLHVENIKTESGLSEVIRKSKLKV